VNLIATALACRAPSARHPGACRPAAPAVPARCSHRRAPATLLLAITAAAPHTLLAQGVATDAELERVVVTGTARSQLPAQVPGSTAGKTAGQLREQNLINAEDALQYLPATTLRKRYPGDRNALIGGRSFGTLQPSRALVYLDGYLISNFLGRFDAPRWNMVSPEAIARVDVLYGPFSALYPGNSIGTTVAIAQQQPQRFEAAGRVASWRQRFSQYGDSDSYDGSQWSLHLGDKLDSGLWLVADLNHQDSTSQPMQYLAQELPDTPGPVTGTPVTGIVHDNDPTGKPRAIFGASAGAIDHTVQDTLNLRAGYRFTPTLEAGTMLAWWRNDTENRNRSFLRDASGNTVWSGSVTDGTYSFNIPDAAFAPSTRDEAHQQAGLTLRTRHDTGWNGSLVASDYRILRDVARQAGQPEPLAAAGGSGTVTRRDGTGWNTLELQATWKPAPSPDDATGRHHALAFGLHRNAYVLDNTVNNASDWRHTETTLNQFYGGRTEVIALYAQDAWTLSDELRLTLGWREERFRAHEGLQMRRLGASCDPTAGAVCVDNGDGSFTKVQPYAGRRLRGHSPKAALAWQASDDWLLKFSAGRGVRFPNVEELYNGTLTATSVTQSDPSLRPETSNALELGAQTQWEQQLLRLALFHDDVRDAILRQSDLTSLGTQVRVSNVDRVKTRGIEMAWQAQDWGLPGLALEASAGLTRSRVVANARDPASVGKHWLRVPRTRATLQAAWRPDAQWLLAAGWRHQGRAYNQPDNSDVQPDVYGGVSRVNQLDLRAAYRLTRQLELALGLQNATDQRAYQSHPYPGRTLLAELRYAH
jgi:iron complex outermembrane receptor protein